MTTPSKIKSHFEKRLSEIYARRFCENNQKVCIDCLKQDQIKISLSVRIVVALNFMCSIMTNLQLKCCPICNV